MHPLAPGRRLVLGGVAIPHDRGLAGHSDADVLAHAVCDAILGALGGPDMGTRFPDTDERHRGRGSLEFLREVAAEAAGRGYRIGNIDAVVVAEAPRLQPHFAAMRRLLAGALGCDEGRVSVKAKRCEGLGAVGRREGIGAQAVALLLPARTGGRR
jgi:2-C-methyl-D-erythritol 2,4-cyclodiphosphate synthase